MTADRQAQLSPAISADSGLDTVLIDENESRYPCEDFMRPSLPLAGTLEDALAEITEGRDGRFFGTF